MSFVTSNIDQSLQTFVAPYNSILDLRSILDFKDPISKVINWDRLKRNYSEEELTENDNRYNSQQYAQIVVKAGARLFLLNTSIKRDTILVPSAPIIPTEFKAFICSELNELLRDPQYTRIVESVDGEVTSLSSEDMTIYAWCKALSQPGSSRQEGGWINLSPFAEIVRTQVNQQFGTFSIQLADIVCEYVENQGWVPSSSSDYDFGAIRDDSLSQGNISVYDKDRYIRTKVLFNTIIQSNDLIYIRFEKLSLDQELQTRLRSDQLRISHTDIAGRTWDMIGLVDGVQINTQPNAITTTINGRDLMKVWFEDNSYFFASQLAQQIFTDPDTILAKRNLMEGISGQLVGYATSFKTIDLMLRFIFNKFSNIGLIPNSVFSGYGSRAVKDKYELRSNQGGTAGGEIIDELNEDFLKQKRQGIYRIIELVFDNATINRVLADPGISHDNGAVINSIRKLCQWPFVEFYGDTYRDKFYLIVRKPPFDKQGYQGLVYDNVDVEDVERSNKQNNIKDNRNKRITSSSARRAIGNKSRRVIPGSKYSISDLVIDIDDSEVLGEPNLFYHEEVFSWYRVIPRGYNLFEESAEFQLAPAVAFDEYAEIWGNKALQIEYNYLPGDFVLDSKYQSNLNYAEAQIFYDLQFLIQSHQYLPFARRGSIILTGNRLIKRGLFINYKPTGEIFYVDSVNHTRSVTGGIVNRNTVIQVSRGMREQYIKGKKVRFSSGEKTVSYFSIINTAIGNQASINRSEFLKNWKVDKDVFNFFLQRRQWN